MPDAEEDHSQMQADSRKLQNTHLPPVAYQFARGVTSLESMPDDRSNDKSIDMWNVKQVSTIRQSGDNLQATTSLLPHSAYQDEIVNVQAPTASTQLHAKPSGVRAKSFTLHHSHASNPSSKAPHEPTEIVPKPALRDLPGNKHAKMPSSSTTAAPSANRSATSTPAK